MSRFKVLATFPNGVIRGIQISEIRNTAVWIAKYNGKLTYIPGTYQKIEDKYFFKFKKQEMHDWFMKEYKPQKRTFEPLGKDTAARSKMFSLENRERVKSYNNNYVTFPDGSKVKIERINLTDNKAYGFKQKANIQYKYEAFFNGEEFVLTAESSNMFKKIMGL